MAPRANHGSRTYYRHVIPKINTKEAKEIASTKVPFTLKLPTEAETTYDVNQPLTLPPIEPFLPPHTDRDTANSLFVLYRAQCTSIAENFRFIKEKAFFHLYTSFHGTLTMPVQKLFAHPSIAPWIEECDMALYHRLTKITFGNSLKVMPLKVTNRLKGISERLVDHIVESFRGQPMHVIRAKVMPAGIFAGILKRMMQVNITAHAAASSMAVEANRDQMYADWVEYIDPREVAQAVPGRGMNDVADVLIREMRRLVNPKNFRLDGEGMDLDTSASTAGSENLAGTAVDRLRNFALSLPERFPYASHEDIVWCAERVGTAMMRQLTIRGGNSFSAWWVAKTFLDEDVLFLAEVGGFLQTKRLREERAGPRAAPASVAREDGHGLKDTTGDKAGAGAVTSGTTEKRGSLASLGRSDRAPFPPKSSQAAGKGHTAGEVHEDSGLGIPTPETDFPMDKFTFTEGDNAELGYQS